MAPATKHLTADAPVDTNRSSNSPPVHPTDSCPVSTSRPLSPGVAVCTNSCRCGANDDAGNVDDDVGGGDGTANADDDEYDDDEDDDDEDDDDEDEDDDDDDDEGDVECATVYSCRSTELSTGPHPTADSPPCLPADIALEETKEVKMCIDDLHPTHQAFKDDHTHGGLDMSTSCGCRGSQLSTTGRGRSVSLSKDRHPKASLQKFGSRPTSCAGDRVVYRVLNDKEFTFSAAAKTPPGTAKTTTMARSDEDLMSAPCVPCVSDLHIKRYAAGDRRLAQDTSPISTSPTKKKEGKPSASPMKKKTDQLQNARSRSPALMRVQPEAPGVTGCVEKLPGAHITAGTKAGQKSFWISSTRSLRVAAGWAHKSLLETKAAKSRSSSSPAKKSAREAHDENDDVKSSMGPALATAIIARIQLPEDLPATAHQIGEKVFPRVLDYSAFCKTARDEVVKSNAMDSLNGTCPVKDLVDGLGGTAFSFMKSSQEVLIHGEVPTAWVTGLYRVELPTSGSGAHSSRESVSSPFHAAGSDSSAQPQLPLPTKGHPVRLEVYTSSAVDKKALPIVVLSDAWGLCDSNVCQPSSSSSSSSSSPFRASSATPVSPDTFTSIDPMSVTCSSPSPLSSDVVAAGTAAPAAFICEHCGRHDFATKKSCSSHKGHCKENPKRRA